MLLCCFAAIIIVGVWPRGPKPKHLTQPRGPHGPQRGHSPLFYFSSSPVTCTFRLRLILDLNKLEVATWFWSSESENFNCRCRCLCCCCCNPRVAENVATCQMNCRKSEAEVNRGVQSVEPALPTASWSTLTAWNTLRVSHSTIVESVSTVPVCRPPLPAHYFLFNFLCYTSSLSLRPSSFYSCLSCMQIELFAWGERPEFATSPQPICGTLPPLHSLSPSFSPWFFHICLQAVTH